MADSLASRWCVRNIDDDNIVFMDSVNMPASKAYHRGNLREDLVRLGREMLESGGQDGLSVRKLAQAAGVSHNAPYMHFADRRALIAAIAAHGFEEQQRVIAAAAEAGPKGWRDRFVSGCRAYVRFAVENPQLYSVMHKGFDPESEAEACHASLAAFGQLKQSLADGQRLGEIIEHDVHDLAIGVWAQLHGLADILGRPSAGQRISARPDEGITGDSVGMLLNGIARDN